jgi:hypothetical protein
VNAYDGDAASQASSTTFPPTNSCVGQCNKDELCSSDGSSEFPPTKCKQPANELCNQCVATPKAYPLSYAGGCWPAGQDCSRLYLCGETYQACSQASCYCWMGSLFANW